MKKAIVCGSLLLAATGVLSAQAVQWRRTAAPTETTIKGGPWTLEQSDASNRLKSAGYCDAKGNQIGNPGTERMQPYYFPVVSGQGLNLQGYFDWRPKDIDEAAVAAKSNDGGQSWTFQGKALELRTKCPDQVQADPDGDNDNNPDPNNSDNGDDDGQGHQFVISINGHKYLYTLNRASGHIDMDQLIIHDLTPQGGNPLAGLPALTDAPNTSNPGLKPPLQTTGLLNPDGILGVVPGRWPLTIIYEQKILNGDKSGATALPSSQQCSTYWKSFYDSQGIKTNNDITYLRLASTTDGINFKDQGPLQGLNDPTTVAIDGTRWLATAGTIIKVNASTWGLLYSGGSCIDADSDAFHYIGYAESTDLVHWHQVNGFDNPIASVATVQLQTLNGVPSTASGSAVQTVPAQTPVVGDTLGFFEGRVYAPSAVSLGERDIAVIFAGYHTQKPKNDLGDYRTIGRVTLRASRDLEVVGQSVPRDDEDERDDH